jgi:hypothetical protein
MPEQLLNLNGRSAQSRAEYSEKAQAAKRLSGPSFLLY